jgi:hypothetical protein
LGPGRYLPVVTDAKSRLPDVGVTGGAQPREQEAHHNCEEQRQRDSPRVRRIVEGAEEERSDCG